MLEGVPAADALKTSYKDPVVKERFFTTPTALAATTRQPYNSFDKNKGKSKGGSKGEGKGRRSTTPYMAKGGGKEGGKGKEKGKMGASKGGKESKFCFPYNNHWETCTRSNCPFPHRCSRCGGKHPAYRCQNQGNSETQGEGASAPTPAA